MNQKVSIQIGTRQLTIEMEELTQLEINALAQTVSELMANIQGQNKTVADTSKIALLVAMHLAADLEKERAAHDMTRRILENKAEQLSQSLRESLQAGAEPETAA